MLNSQGGNRWINK